VEVYQTTITGNVPSNSNCYRIIRLGSRCSLAKGKDLKDYEKSFLTQYRASETLECEFGINLTVYYPSRRADLDNSLKIILDCLQKAGAIKNDNKCVEIIAHRQLDKENPRIEFNLYRYEQTKT
jgi:Holliday junction resolvase RusA-like endonuclease